MWIYKRRILFKLWKKKIKLLCDLNEKGKLKISEQDNYYYKLENTLDEIKKDLEEGLISKNKLEQFLKINKNNDKKDDIGKEERKEKIIKKLRLIKIVLNEYDPIKKYTQLNNIIENINVNIKELTFIKNSLLIFHRIRYTQEIKKISKIINDIENKPINEYINQKMKDSINELKRYKNLCEKVNEVKDFLLFKIIFDNSQGKDQEARFNDGLSKLEEIKILFAKNKNIEEIIEKNENLFNEIKRELSKKEESKSNEFIEQTIKYSGTERKYEEDLIIIFKSKKYEIDIQSINFFFDNLSVKKLPNFNEQIELSKMKLKKLKETLKKYKDNKIYDYKSNNYCYKLFTSFYDKKEAIDFLMSKKDSNIDNLKDRIDPTNRRITIKNIEDTIECLNHFKKIYEIKWFTNIRLYRKIK